MGMNLDKCLVRKLGTDWEMKPEPLARVRWSVIRKGERNTFFVEERIYLLTRGGLIRVRYDFKFIVFYEGGPTVGYLTGDESVRQSLPGLFPSLRYLGVLQASIITRTQRIIPSFPQIR